MEGRVRTAIIKSKYILYPQPNVNLIDWIIIWLLSTYILSLIDIFWNNIDSLLRLRNQLHYISVFLNKSRNGIF